MSPDEVVAVTGKVHSAANSNPTGYAAIPAMPNTNAMMEMRSPKPCRCDNWRKRRPEMTAAVMEPLMASSYILVRSTNVPDRKAPSTPPVIISAAQVPAKVLG
jgi:hypothetical protein